MKIKLVSKTSKFEYDGKLREVGVCTVCGNSRFGCVKWMFGSYICPLCNFKMRKLLFSS